MRRYVRRLSPHFDVELARGLSAAREYPWARGRRRSAPCRTTASGHLERALDRADAAARIQFSQRKFAVAAVSSASASITPPSTTAIRPPRAMPRAAARRKISLTASVGPAATGGTVDITSTERWHLHASYSWSQRQVETDGQHRRRRSAPRTSVSRPQTLVISRATRSSRAQLQPRAVLAAREAADQLGPIGQPLRRHRRGCAR